MIFMALDHASYFIAKIHVGEFWGLPLPRYHDTLSFITRFVTHFCAPGFFFLMGAGLALFAASRRRLGWPEGRIARHFIARGLLLISMQFVIENFAWLLGALSGPVEGLTAPGGGRMVILHFGVLSGLGVTMIIFAFLYRLRPAVLLVISIAAVIATQLVTPPAEQVHVLYPPLLRVLLIPGQTGIWQVHYPVIPWLGACGFGVAFGTMLTENRRRAFRAAFTTGICALVLFVIVRLADRFGNLHPVGAGIIGFLNVTKYPPSPSFMLLTMGIDLLLLALFERVHAWLERHCTTPLVYGRSALFFYIAHLYLYALMDAYIPGATSIRMMYPFWLLGLILLYPLCRWYGAFKLRSAPESIWRFL